jgi:hypothetical protein
VHAVCPQPPPKACNELFKSDLVLVGRVESEQTIDEEDGMIGGWIYRVRVSRSLRGSAGATAYVYTENASARLPLTVGKKYVLFAGRNEEGRFEIDSCGNSGLVEERAGVLRALERTATQPSSIEGEIMQAANREGPEGIAGIRIRIDGEDRVVRLATTGPDGTFRLEVPPGTYRVRPEDEHVTEFDLSYGDADHLVVDKGQCGQVAFRRQD